MTTDAPAERLYLKDDPDLDCWAHPDPNVRRRHVARYEKAIALAGVTGGQWLDCACGSGYGSAMIADRAAAKRVDGIDRDPNATAYAAKHYRRWHVVFSCFTIREAMEYFAPFSFSAIVSIETLEHLEREEQEAWIRWCAVHLERRGVLILSFPVGDGPSENPWHLYEPTAWEVVALCHDAGFRSVASEIEGYESTSGPARQAFVRAAK